MSYCIYSCLAGGQSGSHRLTMKINANADSRPIASLSPSERTFPIQPGASILESGLSAGIPLPFGCANGSCGDCRAKVIHGDVQTIRFHDYPLSQAEKASGVCLMCSTSATSDVIIQVSEAQSANDIAVQSLRAKLTRIEQLAGVSIVTFRFIRGQALRFLPGQQARLSLPCGAQAMLPVASCPCDSCFVEFHLANIGDTNASFLLSQINQFKSRDKVLIDAPFGQFTVSNETNRDKIFIAYGASFAAIQGMIEHVFNQELDTHCTLFWVSTSVIGQYRDNLCHAWHDALDEFTYHPLTETDDVFMEITRHCPKATHDTEFYITGPARLLQDIGDKLRSTGVSASNIYINSDSGATADS